MEVNIDAQDSRESDSVLSILRLLSEPPSSPGYFASYIGMVSLSLASFGKLEGDHLHIGLRSMGAAARHIQDPSLFRSVARVLVQENGLIPYAHHPGIERPLNVAIRALNVAAVRILLGMESPLYAANLGSSNDYVYKEAMTLICQVIKKGHADAQDRRAMEIMEILTSRWAGLNPSPIGKNNGEILNLLFSGEDDSDSRDIFEAVEMLLKIGFSANTRDDKTGNFPLHHAARKNHWKTAIELIRFGADIEAKDNNGMTPFDRAEESGLVSNEIRAIFRSAKMNNIIFGNKLVGN